MAPMTNDDKIAFLLCALRNSGKTVWADVGKDLGLKPDTAAKRLKYITDALEKSRDGATGSSDVATPKKPVTPRKKSTPAKKMKLENGAGKDVGDDDEGEEEETPKAGMFCSLSLILFISFVHVANHFLLPNIGRKRGRTISKVSYQEDSDEKDSEGQGFYDFDDFMTKGEDKA